MPAVPKRRTPRGRRDSDDGQVVIHPQLYRLWCSVIVVNWCDLIMYAASCGSYRGRQVLEVKEN